MQVDVTVRIDATPDEVWALVSDVTRIGEFSPETLEAEWLRGATGPEEGALFRGHVKRNEAGPTYWSTCRVAELEEGRRFAFDVMGPGGRALTRWWYELAPDGDGTLLTEGMHLHGNPLLDVYDKVLGRRRAAYNRRNIATTLGRIKAVLEGTEPPARTARAEGRPMEVSDTVVVDASPEEVWALVADPTVIPSWSPENTGATVPHPGPLQVGERFVGRNRRGSMEWSTEAVVTHSEPGEAFAFTVDRWGTATRRIAVPVATWGFTFEPVEGGTRVTETWRDDRTSWPDVVARGFDALATGGSTFAAFQERNIRRSLDRLAEVVAAG